MTDEIDKKPLSISEFNALVQPLERPLRTFNCGFGYLEEWLNGENNNCKHGVDLNPDFQRGHVWTGEQQTAYIENVLRRVIDDSGLTIRFNCPTWRNDRLPDSDLIDQMVILDGLQRLTAVRKFIAGELKVFGLSYDQLPRRILLRELSIVIKMYDFQNRKDLLKFYLDINSGGTPHSESEIKRVRGLLIQEWGKQDAD